MLQNDPISLKTVITDDEICVHHFDLLTKFATSVSKHTDFLPPKTTYKLGLLIKP